MEEAKSTESTGSSSGEITAESGTAKSEKTHRKKTLPTFAKRGIQEAKLWWRRFTQYIKMTQNIEINFITNDRENLQKHRNELEHRTYFSGHYASRQ